MKSKGILKKDAVLTTFQKISFRIFSPAILKTGKCKEIHRLHFFRPGIEDYPKVWDGTNFKIDSMVRDGPTGTVTHEG